ncbi:MAG: hypothetical protein IPL53_15605 [Ignavibacteria bacterium]|nr:hypothetical protein [Ignavibacteria bacterium]
MQSIKNLIRNMNMRSMYFLLIVIMLCSTSSFSQNKKSTPPAGQTSVIKIETGSLTKTVDSKLTEEALKINSELDLLKRTDNSYPSDKSDKLNELRIKSEELSKTTITVNSANLNHRNVFQKAVNRNSDNITGTEIFSGNYIVASAAQVEQRGAEEGKIWLIIAVGQGDTGISASGDSLLLFSSIDNGVTYSLVSSLKADDAVKVNRDEIDMERIESFTGTKYLHVTVGYVTGGYSGVKKISLLTFDNSGSFNESPMNIPGYSVASNYYRPRITSDNSTYPLDPYVTIAFMQDSVSGQDHNIMSKFFRLYNPFTMTPAITYFRRAYTHLCRVFITISGLRWM